jgi:hypothetical protein
LAATKRFLPESMPLPFSALLPGRARSPAVFPFAAPRCRWYFLGRYALWHGLRSLRLNQGDEVLIPAYNSGAEVDAVIAAGLSPRFFRVHPDLTPDLDHLQKAVTSRTRALLAIHYFGFPQPLNELAASCARNGLLLIEDCALALFSREGPLPLGATGIFSIFCLYKTVPVPHGGLLVVNDPGTELPAEPEASPPPSNGVESLPGLLLKGLEMRHPRMLRWARWRSRPQPADRRAADGMVGIADVERFQPAAADSGVSSLVRRLALRADPARVVQARRRNYRQLGSLLPRETQVLPELPEGVCPLFLPALVPDKPGAISRLREKGIALYPYWSLAHPAIPDGAFPEAGRLRAHLLALPVYQGLSPEDIEYLAEAVSREQAGGLT